LLVVLDKRGGRWPVVVVKSAAALVAATAAGGATAVVLCRERVRRASRGTRGIL
jgi:hypothetical protein